MLQNNAHILGAEFLREKYVCMHMQKVTSYKIGLKTSRCFKARICLTRDCNIIQYATARELRDFWSTTMCCCQASQHTSACSVSLSLHSCSKAPAGLHLELAAEWTSHSKSGSKQSYVRYLLTGGVG